MGGRGAAAKKLNQSFLIAQQHGFVTRHYPDDRFVSSERSRAYINYGNQPSMQTGYIFNYFGQPWLTQKWVREVIKEESEYQTFFKKSLEKAGKSIPQMSDEEKKAFFNKIDAAWKGKGEKKG